jgi:hypothetical protein
LSNQFNNQNNLSSQQINQQPSSPRAGMTMQQIQQSFLMQQQQNLANFHNGHQNPIIQSL